jgi:hypothetical protein
MSSPSYVTRPSSPSSQPRASVFMGSVGTCASRISPHLVHRSVQCSNPERAAVMCWTSMRDWHLRQRGRAAARGDRVGVCGSGIGAPLGTGGSVTELSVTGTAEDWAGDCYSMLSPKSDPCSILLTIEKLMTIRANDLWPGGLSHRTSHSALRSPPRRRPQLAPVLGPFLLA